MSTPEPVEMVELVGTQPVREATRFSSRPGICGLAFSAASVTDFTHYKIYYRVQMMWSRKRCLTKQGFVEDKDLKTELQDNE